MAKTTDKKVNLLIPVELLKAAESRASEDGKPLADWIVEAIRQQVQTEVELTALARTWGRIDSRIDQRTASLEQRIEFLTNKIDAVLLKQSSQPYSEERPRLPSRTY